MELFLPFDHVFVSLSPASVLLVLYRPCSLRILCLCSFQHNCLSFAFFSNVKISVSDDVLLFQAAFQYNCDSIVIRIDYVVVGCSVVALPPINTDPHFYQAYDS